MKSINQAKIGECWHKRQCSDQRCLVALNFSEQDHVATLPEQGQGRTLLSTHLDWGGLIPLSADLRFLEGLLMEVQLESDPSLRSG